MSNNINNIEGNNLLDLKIKISESEESKDYSQSLSILNNQSKPQLVKILKQYQDEASLDNSLKNLSSFQLSKMYRNMRNNENKKLIEKYENKILDYNLKLDSLNQELKLTKKEKLSLKDELEFIELEKEKLLNIKNSEIEILKEKLNNLEEKYEKVKEKNKENAQKVNEYNKKAEEYDNLFNKIKKYEEENNYLLSNNSSLNDSLAQLHKENLIINEKYLELKTTNEELKIKNEGLNQNILFYENKAKEQENKLTILETELKKIKLLNKNYEQIMADIDLNLNTSKYNNNSFIVNNKINDEINIMKIKQEKEISNIKKEYDKILKEKTDEFISNINEYKNKISDYELRLKDKENAINLYKSYLDDNNNKTKDEINLLKIELDNKKNELNLKNTIYQEKIASITMLQNENEKLNEKNESLKEQFLLSQSDYMKKIEKEKKEKIKLKEKIFKYEEIEEKLTQLINDKKKEINLKDEKYFKNLGEKKYNQCLILMNTIKIMKVEIEKLKIENEQLNNNLKIINDQCNIYKNISDKINQPYAYLIKNLEDKNLEGLKLNQIISNKEQTINKLKKQCEIYENQINIMKNEMAVIINNRKQIDNLENLLINYVNKENEGKNNMKDIDRISYFLKNFNSNISFNNQNFNKTNSYFKSNRNNIQESGFMTFPQNSSIKNYDGNNIIGSTFNKNLDTNI